MNGLELMTPPGSEPATLEEIKAHLRVTHDAEDDYLALLLRGAREQVEHYTGRALLPQGWRLWLDAWPADRLALALPKPPLLTIEAVRLYAADGAMSLWDNDAYQVDGAAQPGRLMPRDSAAWPAPGRARQSIAIEFTAGYADAASLPAPLKLALLQLAAQAYDRRGDDGGALPDTALALMAPFRLVRL